MDDPTSELERVLSDAVREMCERAAQGEQWDDAAEDVYYDLEPEFGTALTRFASYRASVRGVLRTIIE